MNENLTLKFDVINLMGEQSRSYASGDPQKIKGLVETGRTMILGLNYNF